MGGGWWVVSSGGGGWAAGSKPAPGGYFLVDLRESRSDGTETDGGRPAQRKHTERRRNGQPLCANMPTLPSGSGSGSGSGWVAAQLGSFEASGSRQTTRLLLEGDQTDNGGGCRQEFCIHGCL